MKNKAQKFVVWDWNGTLLDDADATLACVNAVLAKAEYQPIAMEIYRDNFVFPMETFYRTIGLSDDKIAHLSTIDRDMYHDIYEPLADGVHLRDGAHDLLGDLQKNGVINVIVSNHITDQIIRLLRAHDIHHRFDDVIAYVSRGKQFRDVTKGQKLRHYVGEKKLASTDAAIIGDTEEEISIARELGMASIAITGGIHSERRLRALRPDHIVHSLHEVRAVLQERGFVP